jgi:hypothetical protein
MASTPSAAQASCDNEATLFVTAVQRDAPLELLIAQVTGEATGEIRRRRAPLVLDQEKVKASVGRGLDIGKETGSAPQAA